MELLMKLKYSFNRGPQLAAFLIYFRETCLLGVLIVSYFGSFYQSVFQSIVITPPYSTNMVITLLVFNLILTALTVLGLVTTFKIFKMVWIFDAYFLKLFTYLVMVPILTFSVGAAQSQQLLTRIASIINIIFAIAYVLIHGYLNESLRFIQIDFCNRVAIYFVQKLLIAAGIITIKLFGSFMGSFVYLLRSIFIAGQLYGNYEYQNVQRVQIFYLLFTSFISLMVMTGNSGLIGQSTILSIASSLFLFILGGVVSWIFSQQLRIQNNQRLLAKTQWGGERGDIESTSSKQENNINSFENQLRILVQAILQKNKLKDGLPNDYDQYWKIFNERVFQHRLKCDQKHCICHSKKKQVLEMDQQIYINDLFKILRRAGTVLGKQSRLKVLNIGLLIEIAKKPLKGYYELMSVKKDRHKLSIKLEMQELVVRARDCFQQIYYKNKVQNQQLNLTRVIQCQQIMDQLQQELRTIINLNISFLQLFTSSTVKIGQVLAQSKKLFESKHSIESNLQKMIWQLGESRGVGLAVFVFYRMLNPYKSRENQFKKIGGQQVLKKRMMQKATGEEISQDQGVIYIDLVQERGRIKKITRNIAEFFGYGREEMVGFNINLFMPSLYGKFHAQFLSNFIDKGRIKLLKERARVVFAKNKRKFIFPINIKLKTQHLEEDQFGASALITKIDTSSEFVIAGTQARIEEITQGIFRKFFGGILHSDVGRLNKLCLYKMILGLNQINQNWQQKQNSKIHQGLFIFAQKQDYLFQKFRYNRQATYSSITNRAKTLSLSTTSISSNSGNLITKSQKYEYFAELFRNFFMDINPKKLRGFKISYKYSRVSTAAFQLQTIQIVNVKDEIFGKQFQRELLNEINNVAQIYQLLQEHSPLSRYFCQLQQEAQKFNDSLASKDLRLITEMDRIKNNENKTLKDFSSKVEEATQEYQEDISNNKKMFNPQNSEQSSLIGSTEIQSKRQLLINALNNYQSAIPMPTIFLANLFLIVLLVLLGLCSFFSYHKISKASQLWNDGTFILDIKTFIEFRISFIELESYSESMNITMSNQLLSHKERLNSQISNLVQKINDLVLQLNPSGPYSTILSLYDPIRNITYNATLPEVFTQLLWLFQKSNNHSTQLIRKNYQAIHLGLLDFYNIKKNDLENQNQNSYQIVKYIFSFYEGLLGLAALCSLPLFIYFKREQNNVRSKLAFMNLKEIKKAIGRLKLTHDFLRETLKKSAITRLQAQLQQKKGEKQEETMNINRFIKVTSQQEEKKVFKDPKLYALLLAFIIFFSNLSISLFVLSNNAEDNFLEAVRSFQLVNNLQIKAPLLTNIYLANINNFILNKNLTSFSNTLAIEARDGYFNLVEFLSKPYSTHNSLASNIKNKITNPICSLFECQDTSQNVSLLYLLNSFKKRFDYWSTVNGISITKQSLNIWLSQYQMSDTLKDMENIIHLTFIIRNLVQSQFDDWITFQKKLICIIVGIFIPFNTILLILISQGFLHMLNGLVKSAEQIYQHFPPSVLVQNTYLTSYFNSKLKHGK